MLSRTGMLVSSYDSEQLAWSSTSLVSMQNQGPSRHSSVSLLYADDADFVVYTAEDMQKIIDLFSDACDAFGLTISLQKTKDLKN